MSHKKKGQLTALGERWKHVRHGWDRIWRRKERAAEKRLIRELEIELDSDLKAGKPPAWLLSPMPIDAVKHLVAKGSDATP